jgi:hypothetical protein
MTGDLTSAFNFAAKPRFARPALPKAGPAPACTSRLPVTPASGPIPHQEKGKRRRPSGVVKLH